jgi:predicted MFS family arabinose efflux permease
MVWLYVTVALAVAGSAIALGSLLGGKWAKRQIGGWVCIVAGAWFFLVYFLHGEHSLFLLVIGWTCWVASVLAFGIPGRHTGAGWRP